MTTNRNHFYLLLTSMIWGSAFVFQKTAMDDIDPYLFTSLRFFVGGFSLLPVIFFFKRKSLLKEHRFFSLHLSGLKELFFPPGMLRSGIIAGIFIALGANLQQIAIYHTQVAKVGFITSFYIIMVPLLGIFWGRKLELKIIFACIVAILGIFFMSYKGVDLGLDHADLITLLSALFWALHIIYVDFSSKKFDNFVFSFYQFFICGLITMVFVLISGIDISLGPIKSSWVEILYGGMVSVGIGYTLQVVGQKKVEPHLAALIVSLEAVFAAVFEMLILKTFLTPLEFFGCFLLFTAVIYSQFQQKHPKMEIVN